MQGAYRHIIIENFDGLVDIADMLPMSAILQSILLLSII